MTLSLAQDNFDHAVRSGHQSLQMLADEFAHDRVVLSAMHTDKLRAIAWDLDAVAAAIRMELNNRLAGSDSMDVS